VRVLGEALYAVHSADQAHWVVVVVESNALEAGSLHLIALSEIRCESAAGRRGT
jgi:hypothetical protein